MKTWSHIFVGMQKWEAFLVQNHIPDNKPLLIRIHSSIHDVQTMKPLITQLHERLPMAEIIGCSSPSVIFQGRQMNQVCMISVSDMDDCHIRSTYIPCINRNTQMSGTELAETLCRNLELYQKHGQLLVFMPKGYVQCSRFAARISELAPHIRMIGGVADYVHVTIEGQEEQTAFTSFTYTQTACGYGAVAAAVIADDKMRCHVGYALGVEKLIRDLPVTGYHGNKIDSIGDKTPMQWLRDLTGGHLELSNNANILQIFPILRSSCPQCAWPIVSLENGARSSVTLTDWMEPGETFGLGYLSTNRVVEDVLKMYHDLREQPIESVFVYSCLLRSEVLQNCSNWELEPLRMTDASGAFLGGEFFHDGTRNYFGNCTVVISALANKEVYPQLNIQSLHDTHRLYHDNEHLVDFLVACADHLPEGGSDWMQTMQNHLYMHETMDVGTMTKFSYDIQVQRFDKLCMISVRNGSELVAYAGYKAYYRMVKDMLRDIRQHLDGEPMWLYMTEQGDILICSNDQTTKLYFEGMMGKLYKHFQTFGSRLMPILEFCLSFENKHLVRHAKVVQSVMRSRKDLRFMAYSSDMGMEDASVRDVQMVQVITDAITNDRVEPFYQGIYDNEQKRITIYESLMRLRDADGKLYYPNDFLPVARKYGLYGQLSRQMIEKVMHTFAYQDAKVSMNLSMQDILNPGLTEMIYRHLQSSQHPERYVFEVVECEDVSDYTTLHQFVKTIHAYGCKLALDDFGSGFSNLIHVMRLDLDYLKLDGEIVQKICEDEDCCQLLELVAFWCKKHNKKVIAEYVENDAIQNLLCNYCVHYSQGYLFSKPSVLQMEEM